MTLSLIVPCLNEQDTVSVFHSAVLNTFKDCNFEYEIIYVDDGSRDHTLSKLREIYKTASCPVKIISFSRNFGKEAAIFAGLKHATGEYTALIDADLQQRPEVVLQMVEILETNSDCDIVSAYQGRRNEGVLRSFFKKTFYSVIKKLSGIQFKADASDFRTFRQNVKQSILSLEESHRFTKGIFAWIGFNTIYIPYIAEERAGGKTKWSFFKLLNYAFDGIIGYTIKPLRIATVLGSITSLASLVYLIVILLQNVLAKISIPEYFVIVFLILFLGGVQLVCLGIIGEYVGKTYEQSKNRPIYIVKEIIE